MKQIFNLSLVATALLSLAWLPLGAASNDTQIARGEHGGHEAVRGNFEGGEHIQHQQNFDQQHRPYQQQYHPDAQRNLNNEQRRALDSTERRDWQYQQDRRIDNALENDVVPVVPVVPVAPDYDGIDSTYPDDSSNQQNEGSGQQNDNSDQQNDDANFDSQIWDFNK